MLWGELGWVWNFGLLALWWSGDRQSGGGVRRSGGFIVASFGVMTIPEHATAFSEGRNEHKFSTRNPNKSLPLLFLSDCVWRSQSMDLSESECLVSVKPCCARCLPSGVKKIDHRMGCDLTKI